MLHPEPWALVESRERKQLFGQFSLMLSPFIECHPLFLLQRTLGFQAGDWSSGPTLPPASFSNPNLAPAALVSCCLSCAITWLRS